MLTYPHTCSAEVKGISSLIVETGLRIKSVVQGGLQLLATVDSIKMHETGSVGLLDTGTDGYAAIAIMLSSHRGLPFELERHCKGTRWGMLSR